MSLHEQLVNFHSKKKNIEYNIFSKILNQAVSHIKFENEHGKRETCFVIPAFMIGLPIYDLNLCSSFIIKSLTEQKLICKKICTNKVHISWKHGSVKPKFSSNITLKESGYDISDLQLFDKNNLKK